MTKGKHISVTLKSRQRGRTARLVAILTWCASVLVLLLDLLYSDPLAWPTWWRR